MSFVVGFSGSRSLPSEGAPGGLLAQVVAQVREQCHRVSVGCCVGADAAVMRAVLPTLRSSRSGDPQLLVFAAFGVGGAGSCSLSAVGPVGSVAALSVSPGHGCVAGARVRWWAGGSASVPLARRLSGRTRAFVASVAAGPPGSCLVSFLAPRSRGTLFSVSLALRAGLPVAVFPVGGAVLPSSLRGFGPVVWSPAASSGLWSRAFVPSSPGSSPQVLELSIPPKSITREIKPLSPGLAVDTSTGEIIPSNHLARSEEERAEAAVNYMELWTEQRTYTPAHVARIETQMPNARFWADVENRGRATYSKAGRSRRFKVSRGGK